MSSRPWIAVWACLVLAGCGDLTPFDAQTFRVIGSVVVADPDGVIAASSGAKGFSCQGRGAYADLTADAPVVVENADGTAVASAKLGMGRMSVDLAEMQAGGDQGCQMGLGVEGIPALGTTWTLRVGSRELEFSRAEAETLRLVVG
ncbi:MAG: hypothetical protein ABIN79_15500 [Marmoricola sp.]